MSSQIFPARVAAAIVSLAALAVPAHADSVSLDFSGSGFSGTMTLQYGSITDAKYPQAYLVTGISGTFSDSNIGITNAAISGIVPLNLAAPEPLNTVAPADFSKYAVASGLPADNNGSLTYDDLFWPGGSVKSGYDYPFFGGDFDVYGLLFTLSNGDVVNFWSNGVTPGFNYSTYDAAVATSDLALDYANDPINITPEPASFALLATGAMAMLSQAASRRRRHTRP